MVDCMEGSAEIKLDKNGYSLFSVKGCLSAMETLVG